MLWERGPDHSQHQGPNCISEAIRNTVETCTRTNQVTPRIIKFMSSLYGLTKLPDGLLLSSEDQVKCHFQSSKISGPGRTDKCLLPCCRALQSANSLGEFSQYSNIKRSNITQFRDVNVTTSQSYYVPKPYLSGAFLNLSVQYCSPYRESLGEEAVIQFKTVILSKAEEWQQIQPLINSFYDL